MPRFENMVLSVHRKSDMQENCSKSFKNKQREYSILNYL